MTGAAARVFWFGEGVAQVDVFAGIVSFMDKVRNGALMKSFSSRGNITIPEKEFTISINSCLIFQISDFCPRTI